MNQKLFDQRYLREDQYRTADKLQARIRLHETFSTNPYPWPRWVYDHLNLQAGHTVLEVGCGPADLWGTNLDRLPEGVKIWLGDYSHGMVSQARHRLAEHPQFGFLDLDAQAVPFQSACVDLVVANHMLYHVPDIRVALLEIQRVMRPGGCFIAATNGDMHMGELRKIIRQFNPNYSGAAPVARFSLESAPAQLLGIISNVRVVLYKDDLLITEAKPLVDYLFSMWDVFEGVTDIDPIEIEQYLVKQIQNHGSIFISKSSGILIATS